MAQQPLAYRMRPENITEVIGQSHLIGESKILRRMVEAKQLSSIIFFGPPGTGKTSLAIALCKSLGLNYNMLNEVTKNKKDIEITVEDVTISVNKSIKINNILRNARHKKNIPSNIYIQNLRTKL